MKWKRCPFCGGEYKTAVYMAGMWRVQCGRCMSYGPAEESEGDAIRSWNERFSDPVVLVMDDEQEKELMDALKKASAEKNCSTCKHEDTMKRFGTCNMCPTEIAVCPPVTEYPGWEPKETKDCITCSHDAKRDAVCSDCHASVTVDSNGVKSISEPTRWEKG